MVINYLYKQHTYYFNIKYILYNFNLFYFYRATKIISRYPDYSVQFDGIGAGPFGTEQLGCCSQMAIFYRKDMKTSLVEPIVRCLCNYFDFNSN